jgi:hypothetical protein
MTEFLATVSIMGTVVVIMAVGVMMGREPLKGSCGGVAGKDCLCLKEGKLVGSCDPGEMSAK